MSNKKTLGNLGFYSFPSGLDYSAEKLTASKHEVQKAVEVAVKWLEGKNSTAIGEDTLNLFERWKQEKGQPHILFQMLNINKKISDKERKKQIATMPAWETAEISDKTPIDLLIHIYITKYEDIEGTTFFDKLAWLIIFSDNEDPHKFFPHIIKYSLWLSELITSQQEYEIKAYKSSTEKLWDDAKQYQARQKKFRESTLPNRMANKFRAEKLKEEIHKKADEHLKNGKDKRNIVSLIANKITSIDKRQIRRHLKDHPSGLWAPKRKK